MNDTKHNYLCDEFASLLPINSVPELLNLIDSEKYYNIFTYNNLTHKHITLFSYLYSYKEAALHIVTTRKFPLEIAITKPNLFMYNTLR